MISTDKDTIVAQATASGRAGIGIVRVSGRQSKALAESLIRFEPQPRHAHFCSVADRSGEPLDEGIVIYFPAPHSFTGEDIVEFQIHGGPVVLDLLQRELVSLGARLARPGEFSERAFLNDKIDLTQAEAIADLIDASSEKAARSALRSLRGAFSEQVEQLIEQLTNLRIYVEAAIDFPDEEIDFLSDGKVEHSLNAILAQLKQIKVSATQGSLLRDGLTVVLAGKPNAGKSSLLNALTGRDSAIVTEIEGTTRDLLREQINLDGLPLHIIDTAGLRTSTDQVEQIGIQRAWQEIEAADAILVLIDARESIDSDPLSSIPELHQRALDKSRITLIRNKIDLVREPASLSQDGPFPTLSISAKNELGIDLVRHHLKSIIQYDSDNEGTFAARRRHLDALDRAEEYLHTGYRQLTSEGAGELLAEDLKEAQNQLSEITGKLSADDLLGKIFGSFCIGK